MIVPVWLCVIHHRHLLPARATPGRAFPGHFPRLMYRASPSLGGATSQPRGAERALTEARPTSELMLRIRTLGVSDGNCSAPIGNPNHYITVTSTAPATRGQQVTLYARERAINNLLDGDTSPRVVLFVEGSALGSTGAFDAPYADYSWMAYLARAGFDTFAVDLTASASPRARLQWMTRAIWHPPTRHDLTRRSCRRPVNQLHLTGHDASLRLGRHRCRGELCARAAARGSSEYRGLVVWRRAGWRLRGTAPREG